MTKSKVKLLIIGDSDSCNGCKVEKEFVEKNKDKIKKLGIDEIVLINPKKSDANEKIATMYQKKHINGMKAQPLNVVVSNKEDVAFLGFSSKGFLKEITKSIKSIKKGSTGSKKKSSKKGKFFGGLL